MPLAVDMVAAMVVISSGALVAATGATLATITLTTAYYRACCQVCVRANHQAPQCWYRYDEGYQKDDKPSTALAAASSYLVDVNWYSDTGAMDHITSDLERLTIYDKYHGNEQIQTAGGLDMSIWHVGHSTLGAPLHALHLRNIYYMCTILLMIIVSCLNFI
jgi:hypothetical protein